MNRIVNKVANLPLIYLSLVFLPQISSIYQRHAIGVYIQTFHHLHGCKANANQSRNKNKALVALFGINVLHFFQKKIFFVKFKTVFVFLSLFYCCHFSGYPSDYSLGNKNSHQKLLFLSFRFGKVENNGKISSILVKYRLFSNF